MDRKYRLFYTLVVIFLSVMITLVNRYIDKMLVSKLNICEQAEMIINQEDIQVEEGDYVEDEAIPVIANVSNDSLSDVIKSSNNVRKHLFEKGQLVDFGFLSNFYIVTSITSLNENILRPEEFLDKNLSMPKDKNSYQILIFHTHSQEGFVDSNPEDTSTTIVGVGDYLTELLENYGYKVYHDKSVYDYVDGVLDRSKAYDYAEAGVARILEENPSIEVVIDLHRDGVPEDTRLITNQGGEQMAKVMLFNGLSYKNGVGDIGYLPNPYRDENLATSLQMFLLGQQYYPGYFRKIYVNAYRYCLHMRGKSMLVEAGAQTNYVDEVKKAMVPLSDVLNRMLEGEKAY